MSISSLAWSLLLALTPALLWLLFYYRKDYRDPEPKKLLAKTFAAGMAGAIPFLLLRQAMEVVQLPLLVQGLMGIIVLGLLEEMAKLCAAVFVVTRNRYAFNQVIDGAVYAVTAALGFAFVENAIYFKALWEAGSGAEALLMTTAIRSLGTMFAHTLFSGLAGLLWAYAYFSKQITPFQEKGLMAFRIEDFINREVLSLHILRKNILMARASRRGGHEKKILVLEGIFAATFLHVLFNAATTYSVFGKNLTFLLVPLLMSGFFLIGYTFTRKFHQAILKVV